MNVDIQSVKLDGNRTEFFNCDDKKLKKVQHLVNAIPAAKQLEFF